MQIRSSLDMRAIDWLETIGFVNANKFDYSTRERAKEANRDFLNETKRINSDSSCSSW